MITSGSKACSGRGDGRPGSPASCTRTLVTGSAQLGPGALAQPVERGAEQQNLHMILPRVHLSASSVTRMRFCSLDRPDLSFWLIASSLRPAPTRLDRPKRPSTIDMMEGVTAGENT